METERGSIVVDFIECISCGIPETLTPLCAPCVGRARQGLHTISTVWADDTSTDIRPTVLSEDPSSGGSIERQLVGGTALQNFKQGEGLKGLRVLAVIVSRAGGHDVAGLTVLEACQVLADNVDKINRQSNADLMRTFLHEVKAAANLARAASGYRERKVKTILTVACLAETTEAEVCGVAVPADKHLAVCPGCGQRWHLINLLAMHSGEAWLPLRQAAPLLQVSARTLTRWAESGRIIRSGMRVDVLSLLGPGTEEMRGKCDD
jgi:hypothetical protein